MHVSDHDADEQEKVKITELISRASAIADLLTGPGSLPELEARLRGRSDVAAVISGYDFRPLSEDLNRLARSIKAAAAELRSFGLPSAF